MWKSEVTDEEILALYKEHKNTQKVRAIARTGMERVSEVLRANGVIPSHLTAYKKRDKSLDAQFESEILKEYDNGVPAGKIASTRMCSMGKVLEILRKHEKIIRHSTSQMTDEEKLQAKELYLQGLTFAQVGQSIGRHENTILRLMNEHYPDVVRSGTVGPGSPHFRGGRAIFKGYVCVWVAKDDPYRCMAGNAFYVAEHRLVMARKLGRPLRSSESVHHIDGNRQNNAIENLQLRQGKHGAHVAYCCLDCGSENVAPIPLA